MISIKKQIPDVAQKDRGSGMLQEHIDLASQFNEDDKEESQLLLPHERDETAGPQSTQSQENDHSRDKIEKAFKDTKHGLEDTDCRGIPSNIEESDSCTDTNITESGDKRKG